MNVDYDLDQLNPERYRCVFRIPVEGKTFSKLYKLTRRKVKRKTGKEAPRGSDVIETWSVKSIPDAQRGAFLRQIDMAARGFYKTVVKEAGRDSFIILNRVLLDAVFMRKKSDARSARHDVLIVELTYEGDCRRE